MNPEDERTMLLFWWKPYERELDEARRTPRRSLSALALLAAAVWVAIHSPPPHNPAIDPVPWGVGLASLLGFGLMSLILAAVAAWPRRYEMLAPLSCWLFTYRDDMATMTSRMLDRMGEAHEKNGRLNEFRRILSLWSLIGALGAVLAAGQMALASWIGA